MKKYTESELVKISSQQFEQLEKAIEKELSILEEFTEFFPCMIHLNNYSNLAINYLNKMGQERLQMSMEEIVNGGVELLRSIVHPNSAIAVVPMLFDFIKSEEKTRTIFYEQKVRYTLQSDYINHLSFTTHSQANQSLLTFSFPAHLMEEFVRKRIFKESPIYDEYSERIHTLTKREKEVLKFVVMGKTSNEIGDLLCLSSLTIKTHRQNINKKLKTNNISELTRIASYFDLVEKI